MRRAVAVALVASFLWSCGDDEKSSDAKTPSTTVPQDYVNIVLGLCDAVERCPDAMPRPIAYRTRNECAAILSFLFTCRLTETDLGNDVQKYGVEQVVPEVNAEGAKACVEWLNSAACEDLDFDTDNGNPCAAAFAGADEDSPTETLRGKNEACNQTSQCQSGLWCAPEVYDRDNGVSYCQACAPKIAFGEPCSYSDSCADPYACRWHEDTQTQTCDEKDDAGVECTTPDHCKSGFCNYTMGREGQGGYGTCDAGGNPGDPCEIFDGVQGPDANCRYENYCDGTTCQPRKDIGEACGNHNECKIGNCGDGLCGRSDGAECYNWDECSSLVCVNGTCGAQEPGQCQNDRGCPDGQVCAGACRPPDCYCSGSGCAVGMCTDGGASANNGSTEVETCEDNYDCLSQNCVNGVCAPGPDIGEACQNSQQCYPKGYCSEGVCKEKFGPGQSCSGGYDSCKEPFLCVDGRCEIMNLACEPAHAGQLCAMFMVCDDDSWCDLAGSFKCQPRAALGSPCQTTFWRGVNTCQEGSICVAGDDGNTTCQAAPSVGEACTFMCAQGSNCLEGTCVAHPEGMPCEPYNGIMCPEGYYCSDRNEYVCKRPTPAGGECRENKECAAGLFCDSYQCGPPRAQGAECRDDFECAEGLFCDSYQCVTKRSQGAECRDNECADGLFCDQDTYTCQTRTAAGGACVSYRDSCATGLFCIDDICATQREIGQDCSESNACKSGICYRGFCANLEQCILPESL